MFDAANEPYPSPDKPYTWDEFVAVARCLTLDKNGKHPGEDGFDKDNIVQYGAFVNNWTWQMEVWALSNGGAWFSKDGKEVLINSPEAIEFIQKVADLALVEHVSPLNVIPEDNGVGIGIGSGTVAMTTDGTWRLGTDFPNLDINYGIAVSYTQFQRDEHMRNGRAPENSYGKGVRHEFDNAGVKAGATYKIDGRNNITAHAYYGTKAPQFDQAYVSPRIKDDAITGLASERILSGDLSYNFNYRRFMGSITGFWTDMYNQTERTSFYDDQFSTFMNYVLTGVKKTYKGVEVGMAYRITPSITLSGAATFSRYQYKNRPTGTRSYENGQAPDTTQVVYLKNFYVGGTPQQAYSLTLKWSAPKMWFFEVNGVYMADSYVDLSPIRHEAMPNLYKVCETEEELHAKVAEITRQERLKDNFVLNLSIGKLIYLNRTASLNINLNLDNVLNNRNIQTSGYQQGRFDYTNYTTTKYPNKYYYAQGFRAYVNVGVKF